MMSIRKRLLINSHISNKKVEMNQCLLKKKMNLCLNFSEDCFLWAI